MAGEASEGPYRGVGLWLKCVFGIFWLVERIWANSFIVFGVFWGVLVPKLGFPKLWYPTKEKYFYQNSNTFYTKHFYHLKYLVLAMLELCLETARYTTIKNKQQL